MGNLGASVADDVDVVVDDDDDDDDNDDNDPQKVRLLCRPLQIVHPRPVAPLQGW